MAAFKCKHCGKKITSFDVHEVFAREFADVLEVDDLYNNDDYFLETLFYCSLCDGQFNEEEIMDYCENQTQ